MGLRSAGKKIRFARTVLDEDGPLLLTVDSSTDWLNLALTKGNHPVATFQSNQHHAHARAILPMMEALLTTHGLDWAGLDGFGVCLGPGTFTGLRVGLATVQGLASVLDRPVVGVTSTEILARGAFGSHHIGCIIDARKGEVFHALYAREGDDVTPILAPFAESPAGGLSRLLEASKGPVVLVGSALDTYSDLYRSSEQVVWPLDPRWNQPSIELLARRCVELFLAREEAEKTALEPCYARGPIIG